MLKDMQSGHKEILKEISHLKVAVEEVKGDINTFIQGQANRAVLVGLILVILGGAVKLFELGKF